MRRPVAIAVLVLAASSCGAAPVAGDALNCVILPHEQVDVSSAVPGVIEALLVDRSDRVRRGQVLARLESSVEQATVALASQRAETDAEVELRQVELRYDVRHRRRLQALHASRAASAQNREDAERKAEAAQLRVRLAEDRRREAALERSRAEAVLARRTVRSPIRGVVVQRHRSVGEYVEDQPIVRVVQLDPLRVEVIAPLSLFGRVQAGMQMAVRAETDPDRERIATVRAVDPVADPGSGTFGIELELPNPGLTLPAGIKCVSRPLPRIATMGAAPPPVSGAFTPARPAQEAARKPERPGLPGPLIESASAHPDSACIAYRAAGEDAADTLVRAVEAMGGEATVTPVRETVPNGFLVVADPGGVPAGSLERRLRSAGIADVAVLHRGLYAGLVSLGTYDRAPPAERREAAIEALGFAATVVPRTRTRQRWQIEVGLPEGPGTDARSALPDVPGVEAAGGCEPLLTASK